MRLGGDTAPMPTFSQFDRRGYPSVDVRTGYGEWSATYEQTVEDVMDLALLARLRVPAWDQAQRAVDLGYGTGRTGAWLRDRGVASIDGRDLTPQMLALARRRGARGEAPLGALPRPSVHARPGVATSLNGGPQAGGAADGTVSGAVAARP